MNDKYLTTHVVTIEGEATMKTATHPNRRGGHRLGAGHNGELSLLVGT
ncbi:hypothetical protein OG206_01195 [Streptomyces sp. NBC_01341]|nr:hypothetical protein OG206_01195 [Streptomyces sp. NBC_01341]